MAETTAKISIRCTLECKYVVQHVVHNIRTLCNLWQNVTYSSTTMWMPRWPRQVFIFLCSITKDHCATLYPERLADRRWYMKRYTKRNYYPFGALATLQFCMVAVFQRYFYHAHVMWKAKSIWKWVHHNKAVLLKHPQRINCAESRVHFSVTSIAVPIAYQYNSASLCYSMDYVWRAFLQEVLCVNSMN